VSVPCTVDAFFMPWMSGSIVPVKRRWDRLAWAKFGVKTLLSLRKTLSRRLQKSIGAQHERFQGVAVGITSEDEMAGGILQVICPQTLLRWAFLMPKSPSGRALSPRKGLGRGVSRRCTMIGFQQSAQPLEADDLTLVPFMLGHDDPVETLVNPLVMIVLEILR
jgi:hypothetical protein